MFTRIPSFVSVQVQQILARRVFRPGVTAVHLRLQPDFAFLASVWKEISTVLVLLTMTGGRK